MKKETEELSERERRLQNYCDRPHCEFQVETIQKELKDVGIASLLACAIPIGRIKHHNQSIDALRAWANEDQKKLLHLLFLNDKRIEKGETLSLEDYRNEFERWVARPDRETQEERTTDDPDDNTAYSCDPPTPIIVHELSDDL